MHYTCFVFIFAAYIPVAYARATCDFFKNIGVTGDDRDRLALADSVPRKSTIARRIIY
jgi:hypothetical protein